MCEYQDAIEISDAIFDFKLKIFLDIPKYLDQLKFNDRLDTHLAAFLRQEFQCAIHHNGVSFGYDDTLLLLNILYFLAFEKQVNFKYGVLPHAGDAWVRAYEQFKGKAVLAESEAKAIWIASLAVTVFLETYVVTSATYHWSKPFFPWSIFDYGQDQLNAMLGFTALGWTVHEVESSTMEWEPLDLGDYKYRFAGWTLYAEIGPPAFKRIRGKVVLLEGTRFPESVGPGWVRFAQPGDGGAWENPATVGRLEWNPKTVEAVPTWGDMETQGCFGPFVGTGVCGPCEQDPCKGGGPNPGQPPRYYFRNPFAGVNPPNRWEEGGGNPCCNPCGPHLALHHTDADKVGPVDNEPEYTLNDCRVWAYGPTFGFDPYMAHGAQSDPKYWSNPPDQHSYEQLLLQARCLGSGSPCCDLGSAAVVPQHVYQWNPIQDGCRIASMFDAMDLNALEGGYPKKYPGKSSLASDPLEQAVIVMHWLRSNFVRGCPATERYHYLGLDRPSSYPGDAYGRFMSLGELHPDFPKKEPFLRSLLSFNRTRYYLSWYIRGADRLRYDAPRLTMSDFLSMFHYDGERQDSPLLHFEDGSTAAGLVCSLLRALHIPCTWFHWSYPDQGGDPLAWCNGGKFPIGLTILDKYVARVEDIFEHTLQPRHVLGDLEALLDAAPGSESVWKYCTTVTGDVAEDERRFGHLLRYLMLEPYANAMKHLAGSGASWKEVTTKKARLVDTVLEMALAGVNVAGFVTGPFGLWVNLPMSALLDKVGEQCNGDSDSIPCVPAIQEVLGQFKKLRDLALQQPEGGDASESAQVKAWAMVSMIDLKPGPTTKL